MKLGQNLRTGLFNKIQTLSYADIDHLKPSSLITRLTNDVMQIQNMVTMLLRGMIRSPLLCIGGLIMSYILSPMLSIIFLKNKITDCLKNQMTNHINHHKRM